MVLVELLNEFATRGPMLRAAAASLVNGLKANARTIVLPQSAEMFASAFALYAGRLDKDWGITDCASFIVMREHDMTSALTYDRDFEQAGFKALLR